MNGCDLGQRKDFPFGLVDENPCYQELAGEAENRQRLWRAVLATGTSGRTRCGRVIGPSAKQVFGIAWGMYEAALCGEAVDRRSKGIVIISR
jgi:hypothetical protein